MPDQNNALFSYLMAHPLTASTGPVSSMGEGAARVGSGALGGMNNMLMAQMLSPQKAKPKYDSIDDLLKQTGLFGMTGPVGDSGIPGIPGTGETY